MTTHRMLACRASAIATVLILILAACGDDSDPVDESANANQSPIRVSTIYPGANQVIAPYPQIAGAAQAAVAQINEEGGVNGHPLELVLCDGNVDVNAELACAQEAVGSGVVADVGSFNVANDAGVLEVFANARIPVIGDKGAASAVNNNSFPTAFVPSWTAACVGQAVSELLGGSRAVIVSSDTPGGRQTPAQLKLQLTKLDSPMELVGSIFVDMGSTTDWAPIAQQVKNHDADVLIWNGPASPGGALMEAQRALGYDLPVCGPGSLNPKDFNQPDKEDLYAGWFFPPPQAAESVPELERFVEAMTAREATGDDFASLSADVYSPFAINTWLSFQIFVEAASNVDGEIGAENILQAMHDLQFDGLGIVAPIDFSEPSSIGDFERVFNTRALLFKFDPGSGFWTWIEGAEADGYNP